MQDPVKHLGDNVPSMAKLIDHACMSADTVAAGRVNGPLLRSIVERVCEFAVANGLVRFAPPEEWPDMVFYEPPFAVPFSTGDEIWCPVCEVHHPLPLHYYAGGW